MLCGITHTCMNRKCQTQVCALCIAQLKLRLLVCCAIDSRSVLTVMPPLMLTPMLLGVLSKTRNLAICAVQYARRYL